MDKHSGWWVGFLGIVVAMVLAFGFYPQVTTLILVGWVGFLMRVGPQLSIRWDGIAIFVVMSSCSLGITHYLLSWLVGEIRRARPDAAKVTPWRFRQTVAALSILLMVFVVGVAMAGVVHQIGWMITSPKPLYVDAIQTETDSAQSLHRPGEPSERTSQSWIAATTPFLPALMPETDPDQPWNAEANADAYRRQVRDLICPSQGNPIWSPDGFGLSQVAGNPEWFRSDRPARFRDGERSGSIMAGELSAAFVPWGSPHNGRPPELGIRRHWHGTPRGEVGYGSVHLEIAHFLLADGSVLAVSPTIDRVLLQQLSRRQQPAARANDRPDGGDRNFEAR